MLLAIDVGKGTTDIMIYPDKETQIENTIQLVLPSTAQLMRDKLAATNEEPIIIYGDIMAGEPWHKEIYRKCENSPQSVIMSKTAAKSLRYNLEQVRSKKVKIVDDDEIHKFEGNKFQTSDVSWKRIFNVMKDSNINPKDINKVLLCCQDHGEPNDPWRSTRDFRMETIYEPLNKRGRLEDLLFEMEDIPKELPRHRSIATSAKRELSWLDERDIFVMDSSPAVVLGALRGKEKELIINIGNGHTLVTFLTDSVVDIIYELHTGGVTKNRIMEDIELLLNNNLSHENSLERGGHGVFVRRKLDKNDITPYLPIGIIGPNREKLSKMENIEFLHPGGSMMMAGPLGMIKAYEEKIREQ